MSTTIEAAARTRLEQPDIPDSERAFCERTVVLSEGQRTIDAAGSFVEKARAAKDLADKGLVLLRDQLGNVNLQRPQEEVFRQNNLGMAASDNVSYIKQEVGPLVDPLFQLFPGLSVSWTVRDARNAISYSSGGLASYDEDRKARFLLSDKPRDLLGQFNSHKSEGILLQRFANDTRADILDAFARAVDNLSRI